MRLYQYIVKDMLLFRSQVGAAQRLGTSRRSSGPSFAYTQNSTRADFTCTMGQAASQNKCGLLHTGACRERGLVVLPSDSPSSALA